MEFVDRWHFTRRAGVLPAGHSPDWPHDSEMKRLELSLIAGNDYLRSI